jgi:hypothetical protein
MASVTKDILGHDSTFGGAFQAGKTVFTFSGAGQAGAGDLGTGLLVQDLQAQYAITVNKVWELGVGSRCYYIIGHPQGTLSMGRIVGPAPINAAFIARFTDACQVGKNVIGVATNVGFCGQDGTSVKDNGGVNFLNCLITAIGLRISASDMIVAEQLQIMFNSMTAK